MKLLRTLVTALAAVIIAGTVASAAPPLRAAFDADLTPEVTVTSETSPDPIDPPEMEPTEAPEPPPSASETSPPGSDEVDDDASAAPDFSGCKDQGLTGLENAICRHQALLAVKEGHEGLSNALTRLVENQGRHVDEGDEGEGDEGEGDEGEGDEGEGDEGEGDEGEGDEGGGEEPPAAETGSSTACPGKSCEAHGNGHAHGHGNGNGHGNGHSNH